MVLHNHSLQYIVLRRRCLCGRCNQCLNCLSQLVLYHVQIKSLLEACCKKRAVVKIMFKLARALDKCKRSTFNVELNFSLRKVGKQYFHNFLCRNLQFRS